MNVKRFLGGALVALLLLGVSGTAQAGVIDGFKDGDWLEFAFFEVGSFATACAGCTPSDGGNSTFADDPPWTFTGPVDFTITDAFLYGDRFEVFDFGASILTTSVVATGGSCGSDPDDCLIDPLSSSGMISLGGGAHSITIQAIASPFGSGAAYFRIDTRVPEPGTLMLLGLGFAGLGLVRRRTR